MRCEKQRHGASAQGGESAAAAVDFAQLLRARHGETDDVVPASSSGSRARKPVSDDSASAPGTSTAEAANIAAVAMVAVVPAVSTAVAPTAKGTSDAAVGAASVPGAAAVSIAGAKPAAPMTQDLAPPEFVGSRESGKTAVDVAPAAQALKRAPSSATSAAVAATTPSPDPEPVSDPADAKPDRSALSATLGTPGGVSPAPVVDAHPGVVQALASAAAEAAVRSSGNASAGGVSQKLQIDAAQARKPGPRSATSASVTVTATASTSASAPELAVGQQVLALAVPAAPPPDATRVFQPPTSFAGTENLGATEPVSDPAEAKPDLFAPLSASAATLGMPGGVQPAPVVTAPPSVVQALASAAAEAAARFAGAASSGGVPQKLQLDIDNGEAGRIRMDMVFSEPGHAALVVHASSEAQSQLLDERSQQLVDNLRELGLVVQVSVRQGSTQGGASDGRPNSGQSMAGVAPAHAVRRSEDPMTPLSARAPRATDGTRLDLYA